MTAKSEKRKRESKGIITKGQEDILVMVVIVNMACGLLRLSYALLIVSGEGTI